VSVALALLQGGRIVAAYGALVVLLVVIILLLALIAVLLIVLIIRVGRLGRGESLAPSSTRTESLPLSTGEASPTPSPGEAPTGEVPTRPESEPPRDVPPAR
jgi:hypothetical protein